MVVGDFNLHHPYWGGEGASRDAEAEELLDIMEVAALDNWLPEGEVTRLGGGGRGTTIDLVLATTDLREKMINCEVNDRVHADSDHLPIHTLLDIDTEEIEEPPLRRNWKAIDAKKLVDFVDANLKAVALINTFAKLMEAVIATRISQAVEAHQLLPETHLGGRKGISIDHVIQLLLDRI
jgi:hypothetical protein